MKTLRKFTPDVNIQHDTLSKFLEDQYTIIKVLDNSTDIDWEKTKVASALGRVISFRLGDAFRFVIGHNQRHIIQTRVVLEEWNSNQ